VFNIRTQVDTVCKRMEVDTRTGVQHKDAGGYSDQHFSSEY
jgi:hypothetical protein